LLCVSSLAWRLSSLGKQTSIHHSLQLHLSRNLCHWQVHHVSTT
jgi:hypothetical protein